MTENDLKQKDIDPPFWAFPWPGGQAIARYLLDNPLVIKDKYALDLASGSGIAGIAALLASARHVDFNEIDSLACKSISLNIMANRLNLSPSILEENLISNSARRRPKKNGWETILAGDVFYEQPMSKNIIKWLLDKAREGTEILIGDPGRSYFPWGPLEKIAEYIVETPQMVEGRNEVVTGVYRVKPK